MWSTLSKLFGLVQDETDKQNDAADGNEEFASEREWKEFDGVVTSLHSSYGLIDNEVFFTHEVVSDGKMPRVGDRVHVKASRKHQVGGWKAEFVVYEPRCESWDDGDVSEESEEDFNLDEGDDERRRELEKLRLEKAKRLQEKRAAAAASLQELVADKMDIFITKSVDFGRIDVGQTKSVKLEIRNDGTVSQILCGWEFKNPSPMSQFDLSPFRLLSIDMKHSSRKAQETLPMTLEPGKIAVVTVYCNARYLGLDQQIVVFKFEGFVIGRQLEVTVLDGNQFDLQPSAPYQRSTAAGRYQQTKEAWIVPGQRPNWQRSGAKLPKRLPQYPVPENMRKSVVEKRDVSLVAPVLNKILSLENYAARFSALLFLEEIQQEVDIREFDIDRSGLRAEGEFLALQVPGLAEGRPSLLIGDRVILSEPEESTVAPSYEGIIHEVLKDEVYLKCSDDFHASYSGKEYNVRFIFSRTNFRRCHAAVEFVSKLKNSILFPKSLDLKLPQNQPVSGRPRNAMALVAKVSPVSGINRCPAHPRLREIYSGHTFFNDSLNSRQKSAVFRVLQGQCRPMPYIIFGPPGTGKTVTVVECILQIFFHLPDSCILACTPSNSAADLLTERLYQSGLVHVSDMIRVNAFQRDQENVAETIRPFCMDIEDPDVLKTKRILICTCSTAGMFYSFDLPSGHFSHVFIDEAGQATEPECMIPVGLVAASDGQVVLAGDPLQLGPVLRSNLAKDYGLQASFLERLSNISLYRRDPAKFVSHGAFDPMLVTKLVENYRSHPALLNLSSETFYDGELVISGDKYLVECLCDWEHLPNKNNFPILFHGIRGEDLREGNSPSWFNPQEAVQVMKYLQSVVHNEKYQLTYDDVGIITPYRKQVEKIRLLIDRLGMERVKVGSVEEFQGQERLVMIISTVRSSESLVGVDLRYTLGFLSNPKRFNVAITRAHALLIVIGNPHVLSQDFYWSKLLQYCVNNNAYMGCDLPELGNLTDVSTEDLANSATENHETEKNGVTEYEESVVAAETFPAGLGGTTTENSAGLESHSAATANSSIHANLYSLEPTADIHFIENFADPRNTDVDVDANNSNTSIALVGNEEEMRDPVFESTSVDLDEVSCKEKPDFPDISQFLSNLKIFGSDPIHSSTLLNEDFSVNSSNVAIGDADTETVGFSYLTNGSGDDTNLLESCAGNSVFAGDRASSHGYDYNSEVFRGQKQFSEIDKSSFHSSEQDDVTNSRGCDALSDIIGSSSELNRGVLASSVSVLFNTLAEESTEKIQEACDQADESADLKNISCGIESQLDFESSYFSKSEEEKSVGDVSQRKSAPVIKYSPDFLLSVRNNCKTDGAVEPLFLGAVTSSMKTDGVTIQSQDHTIHETHESSSLSRSSMTDVASVKPVCVNKEAGDSKSRELVNNQKHTIQAALVSDLQANSCKLEASRHEAVNTATDSEVVTSRTRWTIADEQEPKIPCRQPFESRPGFSNSEDVTSRTWRSIADDQEPKISSRQSFESRPALSNSEVVTSRTWRPIADDQEPKISRRQPFESRPALSNSEVVTSRTLRPIGDDNGPRIPSTQPFDSRPGLSYGQISRIGDHSRPTRGNFGRGGTRPLPRVYENRGRGRGRGRGKPLPPNTGTYMRGLKFENDVYYTIPDSTESIRKSPDRVFGEFRSALLPVGGGCNGTDELQKTEEEAKDIPSEFLPIPEPEQEISAKNCSEEDASYSQSKADIPAVPPATDAEIPVQDSSLDLDKKIIRQMEYYFGDFNLMRDAFLLEYIDRDPDGWIDLSIIVTFNRMKSLTSDFNVICEALRQSSSGIIEINEDNTKVRRSVLKPVNRDMKSWLKDMKKRAAMIKKYPVSETIDNMQVFFETFGTVAHIERGIVKQWGRGHGRYGVETVDLVIFLSQEGLRNLAKKRYTTLKRMGIIALFEDDDVEQCIEYFYKRRVLGIPKHSLQPTGSNGYHAHRSNSYHNNSSQEKKFKKGEDSKVDDVDRNARESVSDSKIKFHGDPTPQNPDEDSVLPTSDAGDEHSPKQQETSCGQNEDSKQSSPSRQLSTDDKNEPGESRSHGYQRRPWRRGHSGYSGRGRNIDRLLAYADNMSFIRGGFASPRSGSPEYWSSLESSPQVKHSASHSPISEVAARSVPSPAPSQNAPSPVAPSRSASSLTASGQNAPSPTTDFHERRTEVRPNQSVVEHGAPDVAFQVTVTGRSRKVKVKCFDPEIVQSPSLPGQQTTHGDPVAISSIPPRIPEMDLSILRSASPYNKGVAAVSGTFVQTRTEPSVCSVGSPRIMDDHVYTENDSFSMGLPQQDDDIIIESSCEEVLEDDSGEDGGNGWE